MRAFNSFILCLILAVAIWFYRRQVKEDEKRDRAEIMAEQKEREDASNWLREKAQQDAEFVKHAEWLKSRKE